jgi:polysaccharide export outer membrane protein
VNSLRRRCLACFGAVCLALAACVGSGQYIWFSDVPADAASNDYFIGTGDVVSIRVLGHEDMSVRGPVRSDGRVAIPLVGEIDVQGRRPSAVRTELERRLKEYIVSPSVTLNVDQAEPITVSVLGEVAHPGAYKLEGSATLGQALALGGGLTAYASRDNIYLVRQQPTPLRIRFTYRAVSENLSQAAMFPIHRGDLVVVE